MYGNPQMDARNIEIGAVMCNRVNFGGIGEYARALITNHGAVFPTVLPGL